MSLPLPEHPTTMTRTIRVAVANDYPLVIAGTARALEKFADDVRVVEYASRTPVESDVDVVLFDAFGEGPGAAGVRTTLLSHASPRVLVFTWNTDPERVTEALRSGAAGVVSKTVSPEQLVNAVQRVYAGEQVIPDYDTRAREEFGRWPGDHVGLSARESEVLALICQGLSNQRVGDTLYLSTNTIKTYIRSAYRKIGVATRSQAVVWGLSNGFQPQSVRWFPT